MTELSAIAAIGSRDMLKFLRDPSRLVSAFIFPFLLMFLMGGTLQLNLGRAVGFNFIEFTFTGVLGMTIFQCLVLPQFFLAGVFNPIAVLPWYLEILSRISPMRYAVDLFRDVVYMGRPEYHKVVLLGPALNVATMTLMFAVFMVVGTALFVRRETNR